MCDVCVNVCVSVIILTCVEPEGGCSVSAAGPGSASPSRRFLFVPRPEVFSALLPPRGFHAELIFIFPSPRILLS